VNDTCSAMHPHEPQIAPQYDKEGRCLICCLLVKLDDAEAKLKEYRHRNDSLSQELGNTSLKLMAENMRLKVATDALKRISEIPVITSGIAAEALNQIKENATH